MEQRKWIVDRNAVPYIRPSFPLVSLSSLHPSSLNMSLFGSTAPVNPAADRLQRDFMALRPELQALAKVAPDDKEELFTEKEDWCRRWQDLTVSLVW